MRRVYFARRRDQGEVDANSSHALSLRSASKVIPREFGEDRFDIAVRLLVAAAQPDVSEKVNSSAHC